MLPLSSEQISFKKSCPGTATIPCFVPVARSKTATPAVVAASSGGSEHLLVAQVLTHWGDPQFDYTQHFATDLRLRPYLGYYGLAYLLAPVLDADATARLVLTLYLLLTPLAVWDYIHQIEPARGRFAILAVPALFCWSWRRSWFSSRWRH